MKAAISILLLISVHFLSVAAADESTNIKPYPIAAEGFERMVFRVPATADESARKIEIIVGKTLSIDCNQTSFAGVLERRVVEGWGYPYFIIEKISGPMSTRMACPPDTENVATFISVNTSNFLQRYNSKLPIVVYVPKGFEVHYRIWAAQESIEKAVPE